MTDNYGGLKNHTWVVTMQRMQSEPEYAPEQVPISWRLIAEFFAVMALAAAPGEIYGLYLLFMKLKELLGW